MGDVRSDDFLQLTLMWDEFLKNELRNIFDLLQFLPMMILLAVFDR